MIDSEGFRYNIGIIITNGDGQVLWAKRLRQNAWQFPQGGMQSDEQPEQTLYRELFEELGLEAHDVEIIGCTRNWLHYRLPEHFIRHHIQPLCIGQKQKWYMLRLLSAEEKVQLNRTETPEFDRWRWVHYWYPLKQVIAFKRHVYRRALEELAPVVPGLTIQRRKTRVFAETTEAQAA